MRLRLDIAYDGTEFHGWASQPGLRTIQEELEAWLPRLLRLTEPVIPWDVALVWRRGGQKSPATRAWLELARRRLRPRGSARPGRGASGETHGT